MNTDIRLSIGFWQHPKTKKTARRLGLEGIRSLQVLWAWAAINRPEGNLSGMDWEDVELAADWQGEERKFFDTCLGMWIDETPDGHVLHDWQEHNPWVAEDESRRAKARLSKLSQVNRAAYEECVRNGITGLSQEEYQQMKSGCTATASESPATAERPQNTTVATASVSHSDSPAPIPVPIPIPEEENTYSASAAPDAARADDDAPLVGKKKKLTGKRKMSFLRFWEAFGDKRGKVGAIDAWAAIPELTDTLVERIVSAARRYATQRPELEAKGATPKMAQGWLTDRRWEDEPPGSYVPTSHGVIPHVPLPEVKSMTPDEVAKNQKAALERLKGEGRIASALKKPVSPDFCQVLGGV